MKRIRKATPRYFTVYFLATIFFFAVSTVVFTNEVSNVEFGEITNFGGKVDIAHSFSAGEDRVQIGTKIYANDVVKTGKDGFIEIMFGINVRLRLEQNSELVLQDLVATEKTEDEVVATTKLFGLLFRYGILRVRVRENLVATTQVLIRAGEVRFLLPRSDFLIQRAIGDPHPQKMLDCLLAWGRVELQLQTLKTKSTDAAENSATGEKTEVSPTQAVNNHPGRLSISEMPPDNSLPPWQPLSNLDAKKIIQEKAPFSGDKDLDLPKTAPQEDLELKGA